MTRSQQKWFRLMLFLAFIGYGCQKTVIPDTSTPATPTPETRTEPLAQDPQVQVYFNHNLATNANYTDPYHHRTRAGDNLEGILIEQIESAQTSIDVAVQELNLPHLAQALSKKAQAGVKVRLILEHQYNRSYLDLSEAEIEQLSQREQYKYNQFRQLVDLDQNGVLSPAEIEERDALKILNKAQIPILDDRADGSKGSGLMHHKFMVIDQEKIVTGSANFTLSGIHGDFGNSESRGNANHLLVIHSDAVAQLFTSEFNLMWGDGIGGKPDSRFGLKKPAPAPQTLTVENSTITVQFSPLSPRQDWEMSSNGLIAQTLAQSSQAIDFALFVFSEQKIANTLLQKQQTGIQIRGLIDSGFIFQNYSEGLDLLGVERLNAKCQAEKENQPWLSPLTTVGMANLPVGDKLHHKFALVEEKTIITGSHNWSVSANHQNDETVLIIENPVVARHFQAEFERLYDGAILGISPELQADLEQQQERCPLSER